MRFRRQLGAIRIITWIGFGLVITGSLASTGHRYWFAGMIGAAVSLAFFLPHVFRYWDVRTDRLVHRRYFATVVVPFAEIAYVGPLTGKMADFAGAVKWVEMRKADGVRMIVQPADPDAFLAEMRRYLPWVTLNR